MLRNDAAVGARLVRCGGITAIISFLNTRPVFFSCRDIVTRGATPPIQPSNAVPLLRKALLQSETATRKADPLTGSGPRWRCLPGVVPRSHSLRSGRLGAFNSAQIGFGDCQSCG